MKNFAQIVAGLGFPGAAHSIGDNPPLTVTYNAGGGGFTPSLVFALNTATHITIFQTSWDAQVTIPDATGALVTVGPFCLHLTSGNERWFRQSTASGWIWPTDHGTPSAKYFKAFETIMNTINPYLA